MKILLGVTGSVAVVKTPEIAVQLVTRLGAQVKILLTAGGRNFWDKAQEYNPTAWNELQTKMQESQPDGFPRIQVHRKWKSKVTSSFQCLPNTSL